MTALSQPPSETVLDAVRRNLKGRRRDRNRLRFFQGAAASLGLLLLGAIALGVTAWQQKNVAVQEAARARANEYATKARSLIGSSARGAVLTAVEAARQTTTGVGSNLSLQEALSTAVSRMRGVPLPGNGSFRIELSRGREYRALGRRAARSGGRLERLRLPLEHRGAVCSSRARVLPPIYNAWRRFVAAARHSDECGAFAGWALARNRNARWRKALDADRRHDRHPGYRRASDNAHERLCGNRNIDQQPRLASQPKIVQKSACSTWTRNPTISSQDQFVAANAPCWP